MRKASKPLIVLGLTLILGAVAVSAEAQSVGTVLAYNSPTLRVFRPDRTPYGDGPISKKDLPDVPVNIEVVRGSTLGIRYNGDLIFVRGVDVRYQLNGIVCRPRTTTERGASESVTGTSAGSGSAQDCVEVNP